MRIRWCVLLFLLLSVAGCASLTAQRNQPLRADGSKPAYRLVGLPDGTSKELFLTLAFSGGGKRSSAFSYGVLSALREVTVDFGHGRTPLTAEIDVVTGVSGGSFTAAAFALKRDSLFDTYVDEFLKYDLESNIFGLYLFPWRWDWLFNPEWGTNDEMARIYDELLFKGATYSDLGARGRPLLGVQATDFANEAPFLFTQDTFDWLCSDLSSMPVARAVAASNGFPILFSPIDLTNYSADKAGQCRRAEWIDRYAAIKDEFSRRRRLAERAKSYLDRESGYVHLLDGGVSDNLALRGFLSMIAPTVEELDPDASSLKQLRYVLVVSVDGQSEPDREISKVPLVGSLGRIVGAVTSTAIDGYGFETLVQAREMTKQLAGMLSAKDCGPSGKACRRIEANFAHVSLADVPDDVRKKRLASIPTGLTIEDGDVDALVDAGRQAVLCDPDMQSFFKKLPNVRMPGLKEACETVK
jgi:NTE family protein